MLVSNRITKLHTFLVLVMCLKYLSSLASYGFEVNLLYPYGGFRLLILLRKSRCSFYSILSLVQFTKQELLSIPHTVWFF